MEQCAECNGFYSHKKTLGRHVRDVHRLEYTDYLKKHGLSEWKKCACGGMFENTRFPGGSRRGGPRQIYCSVQCTHKATGVRFYGLTLEEYYEILKKQFGACACCGELPGEGDRQLAVDHEHVEGFKQMTPSERKKYIRGLVCLVCNHHRIGTNTLETAQKVVAYLKDFETQKALSGGSSN